MKHLYKRALMVYTMVAVLAVWNNLTHGPGRTLASIDAQPTLSDITLTNDLFSLKNK